MRLGKAAVSLLAVLATPAVALESAQWLVSAGRAYSQFEGAAPGGNIWESKTTYHRLPYFSLEYFKPPVSSVGLWGSPYRRARLEWWGAGNALENGQPVARRIDTSDARWGWGWMLPGGVGFEMGPFIIDQRHLLEDREGTRDGNFRTSHIGSYFGCYVIRRAGAWHGEAGGWFGVMGFPSRQSAMGELELLATRRLNRGPWTIGLSAKTGSLQLERGKELFGSVGPATIAILRFRQELLDWKALSLIVGREI